MSKPISQYPITFPFGATSAPYSAAHPHKGNDYPLRYEDIIVAGTKIGVSGETGNVDGPHTHVQAGRDEWAQNAIDSQPYTDKPGTVVRFGEASEWGKYVCIKVEDVYVYYCHLSEITASIGDVIGEADMVSDGDLKNLTQDLMGRAPLEVEKQYIGREFSDVYYSIVHSPEYKTSGRLAVVSQKLDATIKQMNDLQNRNNQEAADKLAQIQKILGS